MVSTGAETLLKAWKLQSAGFALLSSPEPVFKKHETPPSCVAEKTSRKTLGPVASSPPCREAEDTPAPMENAKSP